MEMSVRFPNLRIILEFVPESIYIFGFEITIYGALIALGMLLGAAFVVLQAKRNNEDQNFYLGMALAGTIGGVVGGRLYYVFFSWELYHSDLAEIVRIQHGGMAVYGVLLGGVLGSAIFCRIVRAPFWNMADTACQGLLIGQVIGVWGNFFARGSFGEYTDRIWAMQLPLTAVRAEEVTSLMRENLQSFDGISYVQVTPLFLFESLWCLLLFLFLRTCSRKRKFQGEIFMKYLAGYGLGKFFIEWNRTDRLYIPGTKIPVSLVVSLLLFLIFSFMAAIRQTMVKKREAFRRQKQEERYAAEERAAAFMDENERREALEKSRKEKLQKERSGQMQPESPGEETDQVQPESSEEEPV